MSADSQANNVYAFQAESIQGETLQLSNFKGKVLLIVNTASECGFTPQYEGLEELYKKYRDQGLVVLGFPCNQFGGQEPGSEAEIIEGCVNLYALTFPMFAKIDVNGKDAHPLFKYLKSALPGLLGERIKWNFTKFLIDRHGKPLKRYGSTTTPAAIEKDIVNALKV